MLRPCDVFVIGGGPAGLAAAIAARRRGMSVTLADGAIPPIDKACGEGLMPDGLAALRELGIELGASDAQPFLGIRFLEGDVSIQAAFPDGHALGVRRTVLHSRLLEAAAAAGVHMLWGTPIGSFDQAPPSRWIIGADGFHSRVRRWAGLAAPFPAQRYGFRIHYRTAPWTDFMELHWAAGCQIYVTPISPDEVCVALISRNAHLRVDEALARFPRLATRLDGVPHASPERGSVTANYRLPHVWRGNLALVGDASGAVDAITGEGLCLAFHQAVALAGALAAGDLAAYESAHRRLARQPARMSNLLLAMDRHGWLRRPAFRAMALAPRLFESMLSFHLRVPDSIPALP
ncbi:MAG: FAD-dependent monooxygenase [Bryobacteraceae bacterium]